MSVLVIPLNVTIYSLSLFNLRVRYCFILFSYKKLSLYVSTQWVKLFVSGSTYNTLWSEAHEELSCLLDEELPEEPLRPERDRVVFFQRLATFYVRYVQIFRQLEEAYDQSVHPQKRRAIRQVLDSVIGRVLELKNEMVEKEFSEYHYMDDIIQDLKLTPVSVFSMVIDLIHVFKP